MWLGLNLPRSAQQIAAGLADLVCRQAVQAAFLECLEGTGFVRQLPSQPPSLTVSDKIPSRLLRSFSPGTPFLSCREREERAFLSSVQYSPNPRLADSRPWKATQRKATKQTTNHKMLHTQHRNSIRYSWLTGHRNSGRGRTIRKKKKKRNAELHVSVHDPFQVTWRKLPAWMKKVWFRFLC